MRSTTYTYDGLNRMDTASLVVGGAAPVVTDYNHDGAGNRTDVGGAAYTLAAGLGATVHEYGTTPHEQFTRAYDANGNYTGDEASAVVGIGYNADNLMVWYVDDTGTDEAYRYDASNRRVRIERNGAVDRYFLYLGDRILEEYTGTGTLAVSYVYGNYVDEVLQRRDEVTGETYYYFSDDQWNVVALTDTAGSVVERYTYDDFGAPTILDAAWAPVTGNTSVVGNTRLFQGRDYDYATALYHYRARYYDPATGRFTTRDPLGIWGDVLHLGNGYSFLNNNPWSMIDPYGMCGNSNRKSQWSAEWAVLHAGAEFAPGDEIRVINFWRAGGEMLMDSMRQSADMMSGTSITEAYRETGELAELLGTIYGDPGGALDSVNAGIDDYFYRFANDEATQGRALFHSTAGFAGLVAGAGQLKAADDVEALLRVLARQALDNVEPGKGPVHGTSVHTRFQQLVRQTNRDDLRTEVSYLNGVVVRRGTPGSIRVDVSQGDIDAPLATFDLKTGSAILTETRKQQIQAHLPGGNSVPVIEIRGDQ